MVKLYYKASKRRLPKHLQAMLYIDRKIQHMNRMGIPAGRHPLTGAATTKDVIDRYARARKAH